MVGPEIEGVHPVTMEDLPEIVLPSMFAIPGGTGVGNVALGARGRSPTQHDVPEFLADGRFAVQVVMWNPKLFPGQPEQATAGLWVHVRAGGVVVVEPFGTPQGGMTLSHEIVTNAEGETVIRFPFTIDGL